MTPSETVESVLQRSYDSQDDESEFLVCTNVRTYILRPGVLVPTTDSDGTPRTDLPVLGRRIVEFRASPNESDPVSGILLNDGGALVCLYVTDLPPTRRYPNLRYDSPGELAEWREEFDQLPLVNPVGA